MIYLPKNILNNKNLPNTPLAPWIFQVLFFNNNSDKSDFGITLDKSASFSTIPIKADLPSFDTTIVTHKFFGSEKSFPILRKHSGETTLEFYMYSNMNENEFIIKNFFKSYTKKLNGETDVFLHKEFKKIFDKIQISLYDRTGDIVENYYLINCIPTKIEQGSVNYEASEIMKYTLTVHYDDWYVKLGE